MRFLKLLFPDPVPRYRQVNKAPDPAPPTDPGKHLYKQIAAQQPRSTLLEKVAERQRTSPDKHCCHCCCRKHKGCC